MTNRIAIRARIYGRVQGVWYRGWTEQEANGLGLHGWVRNRLDGSVEAMFIGAGDKVQLMLERCHQGPSHAKVDKIETEEAQGIAPKRFEVKPTV
jgi:acylphosphatase